MENERKKEEVFETKGKKAERAKRKRKKRKQGGKNLLRWR